MRIKEKSYSNFENPKEYIRLKDSDDVMKSDVLYGFFKIEIECSASRVYLPIIHVV